MFSAFQTHFNLMVGAEDSGGLPTRIHVPDEYMQYPPFSLNAEIDETAYGWYSQRLQTPRLRNKTLPPRTPPKGVETESKLISPPCLSQEEIEYKRIRRKNRGIPGDGSYLLIDRGNVLSGDTKPMLLVNEDGSVRTLSWEERVHVLRLSRPGFKATNSYRLFHEMKGHWGLKDLKDFPDLKKQLPVVPEECYLPPPPEIYKFFSSFEEMDRAVVSYRKLFLEEKKDEEGEENEEEEEEFGEMEENEEEIEAPKN